jgi:Na+/H+ antiporter NhaD/arsenite permease-like protein
MLIVAPIALSVYKQLKIALIPFLIGIAISSNLQGTATLIGDPPSMILAGMKHMSFNDFFFYHGKPSIFGLYNWGHHIVHRPLLCSEPATSKIFSTEHQGFETAG